jgi:gluconolactonase
MEEIANAQFIAFDEKFFALIGPKPRLDNMFNLSFSLREAPAYIPSTNTLFISDIGADRQMRINLTEEEPTLEWLDLDPPLVAINGAAYSPNDHLIYATVMPSEGISAGIYAIDPDTLKTHVVLNNYYGHHFNSPNDLVVDGDSLWFTDPPYAALLGNGSAAELRPNVYHFDLSSHVLRPVEEDLQLPNGIALNPDGKILYLADSGALCQPIGEPTVASEHRSIYAYDIEKGQLRNRRLVYIADLWVPDGVKVSRSGVIYTSAGIFVDVISPEGVLLGKIRTPGLMQNLIFAGPKYDELWIVGLSGVYRAKLADQGIPVKKSQFQIQ